MILVTGASGFVGRHLLDHLGGRNDVVAWSRSGPPSSGTAAVRWQAVDLLAADVVRSRVRELRPRSVFHLAGMTHVARSWRAPAEPLAGNVLGTHHLLDALRRAGAPCRVLVTGSAAVYAPSPAPLTERSPLAPDSPYALSKLAQEALALRAIVEDGLDVIVTRSFNHTGAGQAADFVAPGIARQIVRIERGLAEPVIHVGNTGATRDLTDVRDVVRAYTALMDGGVCGEVYNVASGAGHTIRSVIDTLLSLTALQVQIHTDPHRLRPVDKPVLIGDASKLRTLTGWAPRIRFEAMLAELLDSWRSAPAAALDPRLDGPSAGS